MSGRGRGVGVQIDRVVVRRADVSRGDVSSGDVIRLGQRHAVRSQVGGGGGSGSGGRAVKDQVVRSVEDARVKAADGTRT